MMFVSPHLKYDPTKSLKPAAASLTGMRADIPPEVTVATLSAGQWWVYPIAHTSDQVFFGLRLTPGVPLKQSSVVIAQRSLANTLASRPAHFVPVRVLRYAWSSDVRWDEIAGSSAKDWKELVQLHHSLGGNDDLEDLRKGLKDKPLKSKIRGSSFKTTFPVRLETLARLDPTPETAAYTKYLVKTLAEGKAPAPAPDAGCWNEALATLVLSNARENLQHDDPRDAEEQW